MGIFLRARSRTDMARDPGFYDSTYSYLSESGIPACGEVPEIRESDLPPMET